MVDIIKRFIIIFVYTTLFAYLVYLYSLGIPIVQKQYAELQIIFYGVFFIFLLYKLIFFGIYPIKIRFSKVTFFFLGVVFLFIGEYVLLNDPTQGLFIGDIIKIVGVILIVLSPTNLLYTQKTLQKHTKKDVEIIEV